MLIPILIALVAAFASALLLGAVVSGAWVGALLVYLAPLPLMILGFGWHPWLAALGGLFAATGLSIVLNGPIAMVYAAMIGVPATLLTFVAWHWRGLDVRGTEGVNVGAIVTAASLYAAAVVLVGALFVGASFEALQAALAQTAEQLLRAQLGLRPGDPLTSPTGQDLTPLVTFYVAAAPVVLTATLAIIYALNVYLAARVGRRSGLMPLAWPDIPAFRLPQWALIALPALMLLAALPGMFGFAAELAATGLMVAFIWQGFAVLHFVTRGKSYRSPILWGMWFLALFLGFPALVMLVLAIIELSFGLRRRSAAYFLPDKPQP
jgi:hypothetical protein